MYWDEWGGGRSAPLHVATKLITPPTIEPFTLEQAKAHLNTVIDDTDEQVMSWLRAARMKVERETGRALLTQTWDLFLDAFPPWGYWARPIRLPYAPLQSVTSVNMTDVNGAETVWATSNYRVDASSVPGRVALADSVVWPQSLSTFQPVRIRFVAGWTTAADIPGELLAAMGLWMGWLSENRQLTAVDTSAFDNLIAPYVHFAAA